VRKKLRYPEGKKRGGQIHSITIKEEDASFLGTKKEKKRPGAFFCLAQKEKKGMRCIHVRTRERRERGKTPLASSLPLTL